MTALLHMAKGALYMPLMEQILRWENYPGLSIWTQSKHSGKTKQKEGHRDVMLLVLQMEEEAHEPKNAGGL